MKTNYDSPMGNRLSASFIHPVSIYGEAVMCEALCLVSEDGRERSYQPKKGHSVDTNNCNAV